MSEMNTEENIRVRYFFRQRSIGFSIQRVFHIIMTEMQRHILLDSYMTHSVRSMPWDILINSCYAYKHRNKNGINHITGHIHDVILGLAGCKTVLTIHDLVFMDNVRNPVKRFYKWLFWLYLPIRMADRVTCISNHTKENILRYITTDKVRVIHNPLDPTYHYYPKEFNTAKPVILHIGTGWNKNLARTITALKNISCHLRIVGKISQEVLEQLSQRQIDYSNVYDLSDEEVQQEYISCDIVSFPSIYEGFGMPIIEGQATGRVVLTSYIEPLIEVSGDTAHYVDPNDIESMRSGFEKLIIDEAYRTQLIHKGLENIERFQVDKIAEQYLDIYREVMNNG